MIAVGEALPVSQFTKVTEEGVKNYSTEEIFSGKKVVLFAVPGAFTPTCHLKHLPGFIREADKIRKMGVDDIVCISVNDAFVLDAWGKSTGAQDRVTFLADGNADFTRKLGLELDGSGFGMGTRSRRYAMIVQNGVVKNFFLESKPSEAEVSGADSVLAALSK
ncbi:peroxiredoxin [Rhodoligotrophos appendicifer]|uniref:peroxiredoxin n=1 Tax=Rhodoligotrophos appendicifer TaxID=987056 RepID=UPI001185A187|nr:peroxiredoxin [Rhodoligotrophos appendicifer]